MKKILLAIFVGLFFNTWAQDFSYQSKDNPFYWKNKMPYAGYWQQDVKYIIQAKLDDKTDVLSAKQTLVYTNNSPDTLRFLYFHLYQNAFLKGGYLEQLNLANGFKQTFGKYELAGKGTEIGKVTVNGKDALHTIDFSIMKVFLAEPILPNSQATIELDFKTYFDNGGNQRRRMKMFSDNAGNKQYDVVHWYPRICVYDRKFGWETDQHLGKEFYGDFGEYLVELTLPNHYIMDGTGELQNESEVLPKELRNKLDLKNFKSKPWEEKASVLVEPNGTFKTWKYRSVNTHDFAWVCDPTFRLDEVVLPMPNNPRGEVRCIALVQEPHASGWLDAALFNSKIIETYSKYFGTYAYPKMIVADAREGMEYPMITLDNGRSPGYYGLFSHEIAHNWFFGMVGTNETYRASLDEGFTQFLTHWAMSRLTREVKQAKTKSPWFNKYYKPMPMLDQTVIMGYLRDAINNNDMPLNTHSDDFNGALNHGGGYGHVYYKTATMLYNLQYVLGDELFLAAMQHYFNQWKMAHPYTEDFRNSIIQYTKVDLNWFFDQWLETTKNIDYGIKKVKHKNDTLQIELVRKGSMQMPVDLLIVAKDSSQTQVTIPNKYFVKSNTIQAPEVWHGWGLLNQTYTLKLHYTNKVSDVIIDPSKRLADINMLDNSWKCPVLFTFDHQVSSPLNRHNYLLKWRPDVWFNNYDGLKLGLHVNGQYLKQKHVFSATVWYNSGWLNQRNNQMYGLEDNISPIHYSVNYKNRFAKFTDVFLQSAMLDGVNRNTLGVAWQKGAHGFKIFAKSVYRAQRYYLPAYQSTAVSIGSFIPNLSSHHAFNNTLNASYEYPFTYAKGTAKFQMNLKTALLGSDFNYSGLDLQLVQSHPMGKLEWRSRFYASVLTGDIAPESQLYLAGANPEEMFENKYHRSAGIIPATWFAYGQLSNSYHAAGGLNVRGYAGYLVPVLDGLSQTYLYRGNIGASCNVELDYDKLIPLRLGKLSNYFSVDAYLFLDAGILGTQTQVNNEFTLTQSGRKLNTGLMASGGHGLVLTIKKWGVLDEVRPLQIRFDTPFFLSNAPFASPENLQLRWIIGVGRSF